jgi:hypothetical protein
VKNAGNLESDSRRWFLARTLYLRSYFFGLNLSAVLALVCAGPVAMGHELVELVRVNGTA